MIAAVAAATPGGVDIYCGIGCGRTGLISLVLPALIGATPAASIADYELSGERLNVPPAASEAEVIDSMSKRDSVRRASPPTIRARSRSAQNE